MFIKLCKEQLRIKKINIYWLGLICQHWPTQAGKTTDVKQSELNKKQMTAVLAGLDTQGLGSKFAQIGLKKWPRLGFNRLKIFDCLAIWLIAMRLLPMTAGSENESFSCFDKCCIAAFQDLEVPVFTFKSSTIQLNYSSSPCCNSMGSWPEKLPALRPFFPDVYCFTICSWMLVSEVASAAHPPTADNRNMTFGSNR